eukprot:COSAG02_NODE_2254_length_9348_cov_2.773273_9_plen_165_part_00
MKVDECRGLSCSAVSQETNESRNCTRSRGRFKENLSNTSDNLNFQRANMCGQHTEPKRSSKVVLHLTLYGQLRILLRILSHMSIAPQDMLPTQCCWVLHDINLGRALDLSRKCSTIHSCCVDAIRRGAQSSTLATQVAQGRVMVTVVFPKSYLRAFERNTCRKK